jgi:microcystin-dependent protein
MRSIRLKKYSLSTSTKTTTMEGIMAVITCFAADFAPRNWANCNGQLMSVAQNQALFSLIGTTYGGNGTTTFALPDLRGRTPVSAGQGTGLSSYILGQFAGKEGATLTTNNLPSHVHSGPISLKMPANSDDGLDSTPNDNFPSRFTKAYAPASDGSVMLAPTYGVSIDNAGNGQPVPVRSPYLVLNYIICTSGIFPSRN